MNNEQQTTNRLQAPSDTSPVACSAGRAQAGEMQISKPVCQLRGENTCDQRGRMSANHLVFVLGVNGKPLTPTTPARARKLLKEGQGEKVWSKFGTFGIKMLVETRTNVPLTTLGYDAGTKFEGFSVVVDAENTLSVKLDLPDKKQIVRKLEERRALRRARRFRNCRRRSCRSQNRSRKGFIAPSQAVIIGSRLKVLDELFRLYPITVVGNEDVKFNHAAHRWGANFSTVEIGKARIRDFFVEHGAKIVDFQGFETQALVANYGLKKIKDKSADRFESHCSDSLALACEAGWGFSVKPGLFIVVDDTYRPVRRKLHYTQPKKGGIREFYSRGTVFGLRKGLLVCSSNGKVGRLCGEYRRGFRYYDKIGKRQITRRLTWISTQFVTRKGGGNPSVA